MTDDSGRKKLDWVRAHMPILQKIEDDVSVRRPFAGIKAAVCIHLEAKTGRLCEVLAAGGAEVYLAGSNPLSTQDDVAAELKHRGIHVFARHGCTPEEYDGYIASLIEAKPDIILDDGGDTVEMLLARYPEQAEHVLGGCEETTTGVSRLVTKAARGELPFPMISVNDALCKCLFDNRYGTGQSVWTGIMQTTNLTVAGKTVVVAGYGWCGKGVANRAKGLGASVIVTEIDPVKALEAYMDGFRVMPMRNALPLGDVFITVTGCTHVIDSKDVGLIKDGAILCNAGHFDVEVDVKGFRKLSTASREVRKNIMEYSFGDKRLYIIAEGRLVNLASGDGHPAEIMDMSFGLQALSAEYLIAHRLSPGVHPVPEEINAQVADLKLGSLGASIDVLTPEQKAYLDS